ncbi:MAG TPA: hypothetical protein VFZ79_06670 [Acidimicrobiales bacterium]
MSPRPVNADVPLPLPWLADMVVDPVHGHVFMSGGRGTNSIVVTNLDGSDLRLIDGVGPGAWGMTLSEDGSRLYVAASEGHEIWIVDTATLTVDDRHFWSATTSGSPTCPTHLAETAGQLWFSWGCGQLSSLGRIDIETRGFDLYVTDDPPKISCSPARLATVRSRPDMVIAADRCGPAHVMRYRVDVGGRDEPDLFREAVGPENGAAISQVAISPDGEEVMSAAGHPYHHPVLRTSDLTEVRRYSISPYPNGIALRDDGLVAAGINSHVGPDVHVFDPGASTPRQTFDFEPQTLFAGGLAVSGMQIFAVTHEAWDRESLTLRIRALVQPPPEGLPI